jgi:hypothetical protein
MPALATSGSRKYVQVSALYNWKGLPQAKKARLPKSQGIERCQKVGAGALGEQGHAPGGRGHARDAHAVGPSPFCEHHAR